MPGQAKCTDAPYPSGKGTTAISHPPEGVIVETSLTCAEKEHGQVVDVIWLFERKDEVRLIAAVSSAWSCTNGPPATGDGREACAHLL